MGRLALTRIFLLPYILMRFSYLSGLRALKCDGWVYAFLAYGKVNADVLGGSVIF
jgi:hypothetical protein